MQSVRMNVRGKQRLVNLFNQNKDGSYNARVREEGTYSSIRGLVRTNKLGVMVFQPSTPGRI